MTSVSRTQALLLSHPQVLGAYLAVNPTDQFLPRIPKMMVKGDSLQCTRVDTLATSSFIASGGTADDSATTYVSTARKFELRRIATKVEINADIAQNVSMINDVFEQQIQAKMVSMWNTVGTQAIVGNNTSPNPAGLDTFAAENPAGVLTPAGGPTFQLGHLNQLIEAVLPWDGNHPRVFVMNSGMYSQFVAACTAAGFRPEIAPDPILGTPLASYMGVSILVSDFVPETADQTNIYLALLGPREDDPQLGGLVWFYNEDTGAGIRVDGPHRTSSTNDILYADLEINIGFASLSTGSVAAIGPLSVV